jgi:hypothetical protein
MLRQEELRRIDDCVTHEVTWRSYERNISVHFGRTQCKRED